MLQSWKSGSESRLKRTVESRISVVEESPRCWRCLTNKKYMDSRRPILISNGFQIHESLRQLISTGAVTVPILPPKSSRTTKRTVNLPLGRERRSVNLIPPRRTESSDSGFK